MFNHVHKTGLSRPAETAPVWFSTGAVLCGLSFYDEDGQDETNGGSPRLARKSLN